MPDPSPDLYVELVKSMPAILEKGAIFLGSLVAAATGIGSTIGAWKAKAEAKRATDATLVGNQQIAKVAEATDIGNDLTARAIDKVAEVHDAVNGQQAARDATANTATAMAVAATKEAVKTSTAAVLVASDVSTDAAKVAADRIAELEHQVGTLQAQLAAFIETTAKEPA